MFIICIKKHIYKTSFTNEQLHKKWTIYTILDNISQYYLNMIKWGRSDGNWFRQN